VNTLISQLFDRVYARGKVKVEKLLDSLFVCRDTCNVYLLCQGDEGVLIDFGSGLVLNHLLELDVRYINHVLVTHHHRDQAQGLTREHSFSLWVPHQEQELFRRIEGHWQGRELYNSYNNRQDRFSLLNNVPIADTLKDYSVYTFAGFQLEVLPTPGHTPGSISLITKIDGCRVAFVGDLLAAPGKLWSLAATQWSYNGAEGVAATIASLRLLKNAKPDLLLPSHGAPIEHPEIAIDLLEQRLWKLLEARNEYRELPERLEHPYIPLSPHLLWNRSSHAYSYVLLSKSGKALLFDYGYDMMTGLASGTDRAARRPWLYTLSQLKHEYGITRIDAVVPTHYHDDHVAGFNLLREVEGAQVWAAENFAAILEHPENYNLPCLWYDPIKVDRTLPLGQSMCWEEYELQLFPQPGHTTHAVAIFLTVDGKRVIINGDQYQNGGEAKWNYVYNNGFDKNDYLSSAELYRRLQPEFILSGHWEPYCVELNYFDTLQKQGEVLDELHQILLGEASGDARLVSLTPYQSQVECGETFALQVLFNAQFKETKVLTPVLPEGWTCQPSQFSTAMPCAQADFVITAGVQPGRRYRVAIDVCVDAQPWGQVAEAFVDIVEKNSQTKALVDAALTDSSKLANGINSKL
jgi:glyoxylase-like metal-dependent hydrolase (beta-lactamase superfamily II)